MPKKKSNLPVNPTEKDQLRYNAILLEEIRSQMSAVIEATDATKTSLENKIEEVRVELKQDIQITQMAVKANSEKLLEHDRRFEKIDQRFEKLENKVEALHDDVKEVKQKLDGVIEKVERHDEEIIFLKSAVSQT